ncbi:hypothetical protein F4X10_06665 [Candidatus Poribacteria bacterium]|nr:hypothetical protein [Candidatus Poribacteria bacterium]MYC75436.1 hypothetical protein [Candidatus Poribacteria bacterium]
MFFDGIRGFKPRLQVLVAAAIVAMLFGSVAHAQTPDLDLVTERSLGVSVSAVGSAAYRSGLLVAPWQFINGGVFVYGTQSVVDGETVEDTIQWRVQGGPQWRNISLQFYVDSLQGERLDYAWFLRPGEWRLNEFLFSGGFGTLLRQETRQALGDADAVGDRKVKGLAFVSGHYDKGDMGIDARLTFIPGLDSEHDILFEPQIHWDFGRFSLTGLGRFGYALEAWDRTYTAMVTVPF